MATAKQTIQAKNILKVKDIIDLGYEYVETNLSIATIKDYVPYAINMDISTIQSAVIPGVSYGPPKYPLWFFIANEKETEELVQQLYGTGEEEVTDPLDVPVEGNKENNEPTITEPTTNINKTETSKIKIELINGTSSTKVLTDVKKLLKNKGYQVITKTTTNTSKTTIINKTDVDVKFTDNIKELLGVGIVSTSSVSSSNVDITIILGNDYEQ